MPFLEYHIIKINFLKKRTYQYDKFSSSYYVTIFQGKFLKNFQFLIKQILH